MERNRLLKMEREWLKAVQNRYGSGITLGLWPGDDPDFDTEMAPPLGEADVLIELVDWTVEGDDMVLPVPEAVDMVMNGLKAANPRLDFHLFPHLKPHP